ncbi:multicopper oxidase family protein [Sphaerisporangium sp. TRM90804]|uniref:multicopper oxidase family protein n=1 Tax=Sphaerisporangium sp. TRM90804 TaxID=3031113 RepID=UPI00244B2725|nr:multicopper oxidase family protein [Sphaerisporangium sp. TRM90804]MDH2430345.1 multicopper oxidase family protein [Sphaerisporangium sp. TRM90804]
MGGAALLPFTRTSSEAASDPGARRKEFLTTTRKGTVHGGFTPFTTKMPIPSVLRPSLTSSGVDVYKVPVQAAKLEIIPGLVTPALTYAGQFVGPTIRAKTGRPVKVTYVNELDRPVNVHLHGGHVPAVSDGHPMDLINPAGMRVYDYPNTQQGATLWYHDHSHGSEAEHVYRGLHGFYIVEDPSEQYLGLPSGQFDVPIMLRNSQFDEVGNLIWGHPDERTTILANGRPQPYFPVQARRYRFRLLNASNERVFRLNMGGRPITKIGSDGGLLPAPVQYTELVVASAERVEIVVDFAQLQRTRTPIYLYDGDTPILRFDVTPATSRDTSRVPSVLRPLPVLPAPVVERKVAMSFDISGEIPVGLMDGKPFDPNRVDMTIKRGTTEIWEIHNAEAFPLDHTFHMHLVQFQVLSRNGGAPLPQDLGLKDTIHLAQDERVRVKAHFTTHLGRYMYHCHYLEHSSIGMMAQMEVVR